MAIPHDRLHTADILRNNAGARYSVRNRRTGRVVTVYDGTKANMDTSAGRWQTVCEDHGTICSFATQEQARTFLALPEEWCEECQ